MRRLFVIIPATLLVASLSIIAYSYLKYDAAQDRLTASLVRATIQLMHDNTELFERVQTLEKHLDATGD